MKPENKLPSKIKSYIKHLSILYDNKEDKFLLNLLKNSAIKITENWSYDNWNVGTVGHALTLYLPETIIRQIGSLEKQKELANKILGDLNKCSESIPGEFFEIIFIELYDIANKECVEAIKPFEQKIFDVNSEHIWKPGYLRLFISHRDKYKHTVSELAILLQKYGVSCFVAHECIEPLTEWQDEIEKALFSMDALLAFLTDDFHESNWTDQEVGVAFGRGVPIIPIKMGKINPYGLISKIQALRGDFDNNKISAKLIFDKIASSLPKSDLVKEALIKGFADSESFNDSIFSLQELLPSIKIFNEADIQKIVNSYNENPQLHNCFFVKKNILGFLKEKTKVNYIFKENKITKNFNHGDLEIPI